MFTLSSCTSHDMKYLEYKNHESSCCMLNRRLTAIGGQNGWLGIFLVDSIKNGLISDLLNKFFFANFQ